MYKAMIDGKCGCRSISHYRAARGRTNTVPLVDTSFFSHELHTPLNLPVFYRSQSLIKNWILWYNKLSPQEIKQRCKIELILKCNLLSEQLIAGFSGTSSFTSQEYLLPFEI